MHGFVAILDVLGASRMAPSTLYEKIMHMDKKAKEFANKSAEIDGVPTESLWVSTFADTFVFSWPCQPTLFSLEVQFLFFGTYIGWFIKEGIFDELPFRGAISYGELYRPDTNHVLGQAVNEAADMYELGNWIGVILTPDCIKRLKNCWTGSHGDHLIFNSLISTFPVYKVCLKLCDKECDKTLRVVNWTPIDRKGFESDRFSVKFFRELKKENLAQVRKLKDNSQRKYWDKYKNTIHFINYILDKTILVIGHKKQIGVFNKYD